MTEPVLDKILCLFGLELRIFLMNKFVLYIQIVVLSQDIALFFVIKIKGGKIKNI